jgi:hypothetical protein
MKIDILRQTYITSEFSHETTIESSEFAIDYKKTGFGVYHKIGFVAAVTGTVIVLIVIAIVLSQNSTNETSEFTFDF